MCINTKFIRNKYTGQKVLVECGKCPACKQMKADRMAARINHAAAAGLKKHEIQCFVTLTYQKYTCPYFRISDLLKATQSERASGFFTDFISLPIRRDCKLVRSFGKVDYKLETDKLSDVELPNILFSKSFKYFNQFHLHEENGYGKIGVIYYKDLQNFEKRVASYLRRNNAGFKVRWFNASEYGPETYRPHFHLVASIPSYGYRILRDACRASWKFHDWDSLDNQRRFQVARNVGAYVASYVNKPDGLPRFLEVLFPTKHSFSIHYGYDGDLFSYESVQKMVNRRDLHLPIFFDKFRGEDSLRLVPFHVLHRYYAKFKGISRLDPSEIADVCRCPDHLQKYADRLDYSGDDLANNIAIIQRSRNRCGCSAPHQGQRYVLEFTRAWSVWKLNLLADWYRQQEQQLLPTVQAYDNLYDLRGTPRLSAYGLSSAADIVLPNYQQHRVTQTAYLEDKFKRKQKQRKSNVVLYGSS